ncbi:MAG: hypothetical protein ACK4Y6_04870 [Bacteroidota bacterium]
MLACSIAPVHHAPVFTDDIAPIIHNKCAQCHLEGEAGPFSLLNYEDVTGRAKLIRYLVNERIMPPWPADASYSHFANELVLTDTELETINTWIDAGMPVGDSTIRYTAADVKKRKVFGEPDMIVKVPDVPIPGNNEDLFLVMKIPFELPADTCIRAIEFVPGNKKLVHHVNTHLITFDTGKKKNVFDGKYWINQNKTDLQGVHRQLNLLHDDGSYPTMSPSVSNYLPGSLFSFYPSEIGGYRIGKKNAFYLNDLHYGPTPVDAKDSSYFKIYFTSHPPKRPVKEFQLGTLGIAPVVPALIVPAGEVKTFRIQATIPEDISLISIVPHMHLIGKSYLAYAVKPNGDTIPLIRIPRWDFRWQYFYQFKNLLKLPRGTTIYVEGVYDNTAENPNNPFQPPREIREREGSMKTTDEMFQLIITYVPYQQGDENISQEIQQPK